MDSKLTGSTLVAVIDARHACRGETDLEARVRKAMAACHDHWMEFDKDKQFNAAVAAAYLESPPEDQKRIEETSKGLQQVSAMIRAAQAGLVVDPEGIVLPENPLPLLQWWNEISVAKT